jgi:lipid II:glycine glycyltransferase (peptidoglycan interpeptide bridge formation enzyme)
MSHLILRKNGAITAVAQARIAKLPFISVGIAYIQWGPLWQRSATKVNVDTFRQAVRALRNEFVCKRGLVLRLFPFLFEDDSPCFASILAEEEFSSISEETRGRTILMDLSPPIEKLREGMRSHWKRELKVAERHQLEVIEGSDDELFEAFINIYKEMVSRKNFVEPNNIHQFRLIQSQLPEKLKMKIMLCRSSEGICAGLVCSIMGKTAVYIFGATSNAGMKSRGSYLLHWKLLGKLKQNHVAIYDLNGINPVRNPGTYKFKNDLGGINSKDVYYLGRFDSHANTLSHLCVKGGEMLRMIHQSYRELTKTARSLKLWRKASNE